jgi:hypothetical protein
MIRYMCTNIYCLDRWHYVPTCPRELPERPRRRWFTRGELAAAQAMREAYQAGDFDLRRTPTYMRERQEQRAAAGPGPGYRWLLVLAPFVLLWGLVMLGFLLYP